MQVTKKTGSLDIEGERRGRIHFVDGAVTGAELSGERGSYQGSDRSSIADILYVLSTLDSGSFGVGAADGPEGDGLAVEDVMEEVTALRSLEGEVIDAGLFEAAGVKLVGEIDEAITMEPQDWQVLVSLVQPFTFDFLESRIGRGGAVRIFHALHRLGVAEAVSGDDESEWLDRLAGGLAHDLSESRVEEKPDERSAPKHVSTEEDAQTEEDVDANEDVDTHAAESDDESETAPEPFVAEPAQVAIRGVSADASTTLTDGVYDEIRRLRSKVSDGK